jgi:hypothetical protein
MAFLKKLVFIPSREEILKYRIINHFFICFTKLKTFSDINKKTRKVNHTWRFTFLYDKFIFNNKAKSKSIKI